MSEQEILKNKQKEIADAIRNREKETASTTTNVKLEETILSVCLRHPEAYLAIRDTVKEFDYTDPRNKILWDALGRLYDLGIEQNEVTVLSELGKNGYTAFGGKERYHHLASQPDGNYKEIESYSKQLRNYSVARKQAWAAGKLSALSKADLPPQERLEKTRDILSGLESIALLDGGMETVSDTIARVGLERFFNPLKDARYITTPFGTFNSKFVGFMPSTLNTVAGSTSSGKSTWVGQVALYNALGGLGCEIFAYEMTPQSYYRNLVACLSSVPRNKIKKGDLNEDERKSCMEAVNTISQIPLRISNMRGHTISEIRAEALKRRGLGFPVDAIFIDHIQFMKPAKDYRGDKRREIVEITNGLMLLSKELDVPVIAVSHLSRPDRARRNDAPMVSDLKESSSIEQDSDTVTLIWRPEQHKIDGNKNKTQLIVDKNRDGPTFKTDLVAQFQYSRFEEDSVQDSDGE